MTRAFVTLIKPSVSFVSNPRRAASVLPPCSYIPLTRFHSTVANIQAWPLPAATTWCAAAVESCDRFLWFHQTNGRCGMLHEQWHLRSLTGGTIRA